MEFPRLNFRLAFDFNLVSKHERSARNNSRSVHASSACWSVTASWLVPAAFLALPQQSPSTVLSEAVRPANIDN